MELRSLFLWGYLLTQINLSQAGNDEVMPQTMAKIAAMIISFGNIVANPYDPRNVAVGICGMVSSIFSIAADTSDCSPSRPEQKRYLSSANLAEMQAEVEAILRSGDEKSIRELQLNLQQIFDAQLRSLNIYINHQGLLSMQDCPQPGS